MTSSNGIVKLSNFCKTNHRSRRRRRHHRGLNVVDDAHDGGDDVNVSIEFPHENGSTIRGCDEEHGNDAYSDTTSNFGEKIEGTSKADTSSSPSISVSVSILKRIPELKLCLEDDGELIDEYATIYTDDIELLLALQIFDGQICMLSRSYSYGGRHDRYKYHRRRKTPVILKMLNESMHMMDHPSSFLTVEHGVHSEDRSESKCTRFRIYVPPCVAATIGCYSCLGVSSLETGIYLSSVSQIDIMQGGRHDLLEPNNKISPWPLATKATMVEVAPPPSDFMPPQDLSLLGDDVESRRRRREAEKTVQIEQLQAYFYSGKKGNEKPMSRLVTSGSLIAIVDDDDDEQTIEDIEFRCCRSGIRFYKILSVEYGTQSSTTHTMEDNDCFCFMTPDTKMVLVPNTSRGQEMDNLDGYRLPQFDTIRSFHNSLSENAERHHSKLQMNHRLHPSFVTIVETLLALGNHNISDDTIDLSTCTSPSILHIIGDEDNHMNQCFNTVAGMVGMNIIQIDGLAALSFRQKMHNQDSEDSSQAPSIIGALGDKLDGLKSAFEMARMSAPCIIRICLDDEIIQTDDIESRHDEESRILSCIREEITISMKTIRCNNVFPVIVVISTKSELPKGPMSSALVFDSITLNAPDATYAKELWGDEDTFEEVKKCILGRSANEIQMLVDAFRQQSTRLSETLNPQGILQSILADSSCEKVSLFNTDENKLSSDLIPNVKWEDVGGLSHVRSEIIDAIELPLRHPDLFRGSRRAGILLFGAPGCGKSLVAKAIATECGLPFLSVKGPELLGSYVGESEANIRAAFASAREAASESVHKENGGAAILFFDEIDSLAPRRGGLGDGGGVMERVVSTILGELDKAGQTDDRGKHRGHIFIIGATNRPDLLDPSLLRPGRFDRLVYLGLPTARDDRVSILAAQTRKFRFEANEDAITMAEKAIDFIPDSLSGADFSAVASGALMLALQRVCDQVDHEVDIAGSDLTTVQDILSSWPKEKLYARVSLKDIITASEMVTPSVSKEDLEKYQGMQNEYCGQTKHK